MAELHNIKKGDLSIVLQICNLVMQLNSDLILLCSFVFTQITFSVFFSPSPEKRVFSPCLRPCDAVMNSYLLRFADDSNVCRDIAAGEVELGLPYTVRVRKWSSNVCVPTGQTLV